jgi:hypothetical protein
MGEDGFEAGRALLKDPDMFQRFRVPDGGEPLGQAGLAPDADLIVVRRGGLSRAFLVSEMAYHHVGQGVLAGEPYLVTF